MFASNEKRKKKKHNIKLKHLQIKLFAFKTTLL